MLHGYLVKEALGHRRFADSAEAELSAVIYGS